MIDGRVVDDPMAQQRPFLHQSQHGVSSQPAASRLVDCAEEEPPCSACPRAEPEPWSNIPERSRGVRREVPHQPRTPSRLPPPAVSCFVPLRPNQPAAFRIEDRAMLSNLAVRDIETLVHPYTNLAQFRETGPLVIERGKGVFVYDSRGKAYLEGMAGLWCTALGYGNEELVEAAAAQMRKLPFGHLFTGKSHDPAIELGERLKEIAPVPTSKVFFCASGSEANDSQIKLGWYMNNALGRPSKKKSVSRIKAYHGVTIASASLTGLPNNHRDFDLPIPGFLHTACPHHYRFAVYGETEEAFATRLADELEALILCEDPETVAAFIAEPVMGAGGVIVPPRTYFEKIAAVCTKYDVYMIADEVICGFGRLGTPFGSQALGFRADGVSIAKALSSGFAPIAAVLVPERMYEALLIESRKIGTFGHGFTYSGHPVAAAVAVKALDIYARERVVELAAAKAPQFQARLRALDR